MTKTRAKTAAAAIKVPQTRAEASDFLRLIGELNRQIGRVEADMNDDLAVVKNRAESIAEPIRAEASALLEGLKIWCEANRTAILPKGLKTADLGTGTVSWRHRPPTVSLRGVEQVIEAARLIPGVSIGSAGEEFIAEPFEAALEPAAS